MRVAIDAGPLADRRTGVGRYTYELVRHLAARVELRPYVVSLRAARKDGVHRWRLPARLAQAAWRRLDRPALERLVGVVDVVHGTNFVLPAARRAAGVVTVHDVSFLGGDGYGGSARLERLVAWSVRRARAVLVPTHAVAGEVAERYGLERERLFVTPEGVDERFFDAEPMSGAELEAQGIRTPFCLALGTAGARKNLECLLAAWEASVLRNGGWSLVLAGPAARPASRLPSGVVATGYVAEESLPSLLAAAELFCYPSLHEGFGLPPLEAMAAGTAVLAARYPAAPEVLGEAALLVDGRDVGELADALRRLAADGALRDRLREAGPLHARRFTWERTASATLEAYRAAAM